MGARPGVYVRADAARLDGISRVVERAGCTLAEVDSAEAIVWAADEPAALRELLHEGVRFVQLSSAGIEDWFATGVIDDARVWAAAKGVYAPPIAEYCLWAALAICRRLVEACSLRSWSPLPPKSLSATTILVIGAGGIGERLIELVTPWGARTIAVTRSGRPVAGATASVPATMLDSVLEEADITVLAAPSTYETRGLLSRSRLGAMKHGSWIVNVARGTLVDTPALVELLDDGRIGGAFLDVTDPEPLPPEHPLWGRPNVVISCHTGSTPAIGQSLFELRVETNLRRFRNGQPPLGAVDLEHGY